MISFIRLVVALAFLLSVTFTTQAQEAQLPLTEGVIKKLDLAGGKLTIAHGDIANLHMPAMTMGFTASPPSLLAKWKVGDKIRFRATQAKGQLTVVSIEAAK